MTTKWTTSKLGKIATVGAGNSAPQDADSFSDSGPFFIRTSDVGRIKYGEISESHDRLNPNVAKRFRKFRPGTVLMPKSGASTFNNNRVITTIAAHVSSHLATIEANEGILNDRFVWYYLTTVKAQDLMQDQAYPSLSLKQISDIEIPLPPLDEQKRIVAKLDDALGDLELITQNSNVELGKLDSLWTKSIDDYFYSVLGADLRVETLKLGDIAEFRPPKRQVKAILSDGDEVTFMGMNALGELRIDETSLDVRALSDVYSSYTYFQDGDVLLAKITPCYENGKLGIARNLKNGVGFGSSEFMVIRPNEKLAPEYAQYFLAQGSVRFQAIKNMTGSVGHKRVPENFIKSLEIPLPPLDEQIRIVAKLDSLKTEIENVKSLKQQTLRESTHLRSSILSAAFAGDL